MKRHFLVLISLISLLSNLAAGSTTLNKSKNLPQKVSFTLTLENLPGFNEPGSFWEVSYDWLIADKKEYYEKTRLQDEPVMIGDVLAKSNITLRNLDQQSNRLFHVQVPVEGSLAQRLRSESENPQVFLLRANLRIYDAKIKKTIIHLIARAWELKFFPNGNASISIKVRENGDFGISGPLIKTLPPGYKIINGTPSVSPPTSKNKKTKQKAASKPKKRIKSKSN
jgi:hypothetical protein